MKKYFFILLLLLFVVNLCFSQTKRIKLLQESGVWMVPGTLNGSKFNFALDTAVSDVLISSDFFSVMKKQAIVNENDIIKRESYADANGYLNELIFINIREIIIAGHKVANVKALVSSSTKNPILLGQAFLSSFPSFTQTNDGYLVLNNKEPITETDLSIVNNTKSKNSSISINNQKINSNSYSSHTSSILLYELNNNIPLNITYLPKTAEGQTGIYIGCGFKFGKTPNSSGRYQIEDGEPVLYYGGTSVGSFGPIIKSDESIYMFNLGGTTHLFSKFWFSVGIGFERNIVVEQRRHYESSGDYWGTYWIENKDESGDDIFVESDLYLKIFDKIAVKYGITLKYPVFNSAVGIGYCF